MDPVTLASATTTLLAPYLVKLGENLASEAGKKLPDQIGKLWDKIYARIQDKPASVAAANDLTAKAGDPDNQEAFAVQLKRVLKEDPTFAEEIQKLFDSAQPATGTANTGSGAAASGHGVAAGAGGIAIGGNVGGGIILGSNNQVTSGKPPEEQERS